MSLAQVCAAGGLVLNMTHPSDQSDSVSNRHWLDGKHGRRWYDLTVQARLDGMPAHMHPQSVPLQYTYANLPFVIGCLRYPYHYAHCMLSCTRNATCIRAEHILQCCTSVPRTMIRCKMLFWGPEYKHNHRGTCTR